MKTICDDKGIYSVPGDPSSLEINVPVSGEFITNILKVMETTCASLSEEIGKLRSDISSLKKDLANIKQKQAEKPKQLKNALREVPAK